MSTALQPFGNALPARRAGQLAPSGRLRAGAGVQTPAGSVSAFFSLEGYDKRRGVATYALRVVNRTKSALVCRTWVITSNGEAVLAYPALFEIEPYSTSATQVPVWPKDFGAFDRAVAEVVGNGVHCLVEAAAPVLRKPTRTYALVAGTSLAAGTIALISALALRGAVPRIAAFAVPPQALAGTTVQAEYSAFGSGRLSYIVTAPDGRRIQGGPLDDRSGSIFVAIPPGSSPGAYVLRMAMDGPLGSTNETRVINAVPSTTQAASIADINVHPLVAKPGQRVSVAYSAAADGGYVRLVDSEGTIWAQAPFSRDGTTNLAVPPISGAREMHVLLHVTKGRSAAQSVAGFLIAAMPTARLAASGQQIVGDDDPTLGAANDNASDANGTFAVATRTVRGGGAISVRILSPRNGMHIGLTDGQSHEITGTDVGADADVITLRAPAVSVATRYTVVASFTDGFGQESIVQPITILP